MLTDSCPAVPACLQSFMNDLEFGNSILMGYLAVVHGLAVG